MKGDFSRSTFNPNKKFSGVLMQQGRVQLDSDWNEQTRLLLHRLETMARDLIGIGGGPDLRDGGGFDLTLDLDRSDFIISKGRYYVEGRLVENDNDVYYSSHSVESGKSSLDRDKVYLAYLDAWEDFVSAAEDPDLREIALGGADTAGRSKVFWRVRVLPITGTLASTLKCQDIEDYFKTWVKDLRDGMRGQLKVRLNQGQLPDDDPCIIPPSNRYRGSENQLYRIEIHSGGSASSGRAGAGPSATFKWSRENGSVVFPVTAVNGEIITVDSFGRDLNRGLRVGNWVELLDSNAISLQSPNALLQVAKLYIDKRQVEVKDKPPAIGSGGLLRRWDQFAGVENKGGSKLVEGAIPIREGSGESNWISLENGIEIQFQLKGGNQYQPGDYWLIPARTASAGQILWPGGSTPDAMPPSGINHFYAPLGVFQFSKGNKLVCQMRKVIGHVIDIQTT